MIICRDEKSDNATTEQVMMTVEEVTASEVTETLQSFPSSAEEEVLKTDKDVEQVDGEGYSGSEDSDSNLNSKQGVKIPMERRPYYEATEKYRKTLRLSSEQIVRFEKQN